MVESGRCRFAGRRRTCPGHARSGGPPPGARDAGRCDAVGHQYRAQRVTCGRRPGLPVADPDRARGGDCHPAITRSYAGGGSWRARACPCHVGWRTVDFAALNLESGDSCARPRRLVPRLALAPCNCITPRGTAARYPRPRHRDRLAGGRAPGLEPADAPSARRDRPRRASSLRRHSEAHYGVSIPGDEYWPFSAWVLALQLADAAIASPAFLPPRSARSTDRRHDAVRSANCGTDAELHRAGARATLLACACRQTAGASLSASTRTVKVGDG